MKDSRDSVKEASYNRRCLVPLLGIFFFSAFYVIMSSAYDRNIDKPVQIVPVQSKIMTGPGGSVYMDDKVIMRLLKKDVNDRRGMYSGKKRYKDSKGSKHIANHTSYVVVQSNKSHGSEINQYKYKIYSDIIPTQADPPAGFSLREEVIPPVLNNRSDSNKTDQKSVHEFIHKHSKIILEILKSHENSTGHTSGEYEQNKKLKQLLLKLKDESESIVRKMTLFEREDRKSSPNNQNSQKLDQMAVKNAIDPIYKESDANPNNQREPHKFQINHINRTILNLIGNVETNKIELQREDIKKGEQSPPNFKVLNTDENTTRKLTGNMTKRTSVMYGFTTRGPTKRTTTGGNAGNVVRPQRPTARPYSCDNCFKRPYEFIINSPEVCHGLRMDPNGDPDLELLLLITTIPQHKERRDGIRSTWAGLTEKNSHYKVRYIFLMGHVSDETDTQISMERHNYKDIALQSFTESYSNLTLKTLMAFEWAEKFCPGARYLMKTDDDVYVNVHNILRFIDSEKPEGTIFGSCSITAGPIRDKSSKWYVSELQYPQSSYPGFCSGTGYVTTRKVAEDILHISPSVPFFYLEDVYISLCADKVGHKLRPVNGFNNWKIPVFSYSCGSYKGPYMYTSHGFIPPQLQNVWNRCGPKSL